MYLKLLLIIGCSLILFGEEKIITNNRLNKILKEIKLIKIKNVDNIAYSLGSCWYSISDKPNEFSQIYIIISSKQFQVKIIKSNLEKEKNRRLVKCIVNKLIDVKKEINETITYKTSTVKQ